MCKELGILWVIACGLVLCATGPSADVAIADDGPATEQERVATAEQVASWIDDLDSNSFAARDQATERLILAGKPAAEQLGSRLQQASLESLVRGLIVLHHLADVPDESVSETAFGAILTLAKSDIALVRRRARDALDDVAASREQTALAALQAVGAKVIDGRWQANTNSLYAPAWRTVKFDQDWTGTDADFRHLRWLRNVEAIVASGDKINNAFLQQFTTFQHLSAIRLHRTNVSDAGIAALRNMRSLQVVDVRYTAITDTSIDVLATLTGAHTMWLFGTKVTDDGAARLANGLTFGELRFHSGGALLGVSCQNIPGRCDVTSVQAETAAEKAGVETGDIIVEYGGVPINSFDQLRQLIGVDSPGKETSLTVLRAGEKKVITLTLGEWDVDAP